MINVVLENSEYFSVNGIFYPREFIGKTANGQLAIVNVNDTGHMITAFSNVEMFNIGGVVYDSLSELEDNLLEITFVENGINYTDITENLQNAINSGNVILGAGEFIISQTLIIPSNTSINGIYGKTFLKPAEDFTGPLIKLENAENVKISNLHLIGELQNKTYTNNIAFPTDNVQTLTEALTGHQRTTNDAIKLINSKDIFLENLLIKNFSGTGLNVNGGGDDVITGVKVSNIWIRNCHTGMINENKNEYSNYQNINIGDCQIGVYCASGNINHSEMNVTLCNWGMIYDEGYNHAHAILTSTQIKHTRHYGLVFNEVTLGQYCTGLCLDFAKILIKDSKGVFIDARLGFWCGLESTGNVGGRNIANISSINGFNSTITGSNTIVNHNNMATNI